MIKVLLTSIKLSQTYGINAVIYRLRQIPLIRKLFSVKEYADSGLKMVIRIYISLYHVIKTLLGTVFYVGIMIYLPLVLLERTGWPYLLHIFFWLSLVGAISNTYLFSATKEKYYAIILMRMDGQRFARATYSWFLFYSLLSFLPVMMIFGLILQTPLPVIILMSIFMVAAKIIGVFCLVRYYEKTGNIIMETTWKVVFPLGLIFCLLGYGPVLAGWIIPPVFYIALMVLAVILAVFPFVLLWKYQSYGRLFKEMLNPNVIMFNARETAKSKQQKTYRQNISDAEVYLGDKRGYEYFHAIFLARHKKLLTNSVKYQSVMCLIIAAVLVVGAFLSGSFRAVINHRILVALPYMVFVMYLLNRSNTMTQAMFMNCDHSMLTYRFYRKKETILDLFKIRLRTLAVLNLIPAAIIGCGIALLAFVSGGVDHPFIYVFIVISILSMSVFFSVHHLTLYYLLQPYNSNIESKSKLYGIINWLTYFVCYMFISFEAPLFLFSVLSIVFSIAYIGVALILVYRYAPKSFRLK